MVEKLKAAGVGVECRGRLVAALLYADNAVLCAENEEGLHEVELRSGAESGQWRLMWRNVGSCIEEEGDQEDRGEVLCWMITFSAES